MDPIIWEGTAWDLTSRWSSTSITTKCDGCGNEVQSVGLFSGLDQDGKTIEAKWCSDCEDTARMG